MSKSQIACFISSTECSVVRLKTSGVTGYSLTDCKTLPFDLGDLNSGKGKRLLNKLGKHLEEWHDEELTLCVEPTVYYPLPAFFPANASRDECKEYCRIEAGYFLTNPEKYSCDHTCYCDHAGSETLEKRLLLFYPDEECKTLALFLSSHHKIVFSGSIQLPLVCLSKFAEEPQVILELGNNSVLLSIARNGRIETFAYHKVKSREEMEYFAIKVLTENRVCRETDVQVAGTNSNKAMIALLRRETSITFKALGLPPSISISNPQRFAVSSASAVKAISAALMALME